MRRIIMAVVLAAGIIGAAHAQTWQPAGKAKAAKHDCSKFKHISVTEGIFTAEVQIEGVGVVNVNGIAAFTVDQASGKAEVVFAGGGKGVLEGKLPMVRITLAAQGDKD